MQKQTIKYLAVIATLVIMLFVACKGNDKIEDKETVAQNNAIQPSKETFANPLLPSGADPWSIYHEGNYYYIKSGNRSITLMRTADITELRHAEKMVVWKAAESGDHSKEIWAPEIHNINDNWYIYFAADDGDNKNHRMFVLENTSQNPFEGEFQVKSKIKTDAGDNWAIDGSIFEYNGNLYFIWSGWESFQKTQETQNIYIAHMSDPWTIDSDRVLLSTPELEWERVWKYEGVWTPDHPVYVNEGPQFLEHGDKMHIIYSASGCWTPYYALGMLTADKNVNPMNPKSWTKSKEPIFQQSQENGVYGPGHNSFFRSPDGSEDWILYHANDTPTDGCGDKRSPRAQKIGWSEDDMPLLGVPVSTTTELEKPSGTK